MKHTLNDLLGLAEISLDELVDIVNQTGGRDPGTPIIYSEKCSMDGCGEVFFSVTQDHFMRLNNGHPTHCPTCREQVRRNKKADSKRNRYKNR